MQVDFSPAAERDLEEIGDYIAQDNPVRAVTFIRELRQHCQRILEAPRAAPVWPELGDNVRMTVHGRYLILYTLTEAAIRKERVLHGARNRPSI